MAAEKGSTRWADSTASANVKDGASASGKTTKLQWRPVRPNRDEIDQPVRTVRYEEDVFADGPALTRRARLAAAPLQLDQPQEEPKSPFDPDYVDRPEPTPTPTPETTPTPQPPPRERTPEPMPEPTEPMEPTPTPRLQPSTPSEPEPSPPRETPEPGRDPFAPRPTPRQPEPPETFQPRESEPLEGFDFPEPERLTRSPQEDCETAYNNLKQNTIDKLSIDIKIAGQVGSDVPYECTLGDDPFDPRHWRMTTYTWKASALCHKPLYFEDAKLERYGHSHGPVCEYLVSAAHFFGDVVLLPYNMGVKTPCECEYALGYYRPGDCAPYMLDPFPFSLRGAAFGAVGYGATIALFP